MVWHASPELIAAFVVLVILLSSKNMYVELSVRDKLFSVLLHYTIASFIINLGTVATVAYAQQIPLWVNNVVNTLFFAVYPFMMDLLIGYIILYVYEKAPPGHIGRQKSLFIFIGVTYALYLIFVILNLHNGWLFYFDDQFRYIQGILNDLPVYLALVHIICGVSVLVLERRYIDSFFLYVISWFPIVSVFVLIAQILFPEIILSGTAMMIGILSVYLNFQTRKISLDNLTQLPNREYFVSSLYSSLRKGKEFSMILISLDDFKAVNDTFGQKKGDACIKAFSSEIKSYCGEGQLFRYGGDDFILIVSQKNKISCVKKIKERLSSPWEVEGISTKLSATIVSINLPITNAQEKDADPITLLDHFKRYAKSTHKGTYVPFDDTILNIIRRKQTIINTLYESLENHTLRVVYQPIVDLRTGEISLYESLLRMNDAELQAISPAEFIPIAEEIGIIEKLTMTVLEVVCSVQKQLDEKNLPVPKITVNFSVSHFSNKKLMSRMLAYIIDHPSSKGKIIFEITESIFITTSFEEVLTKMQPFLDHGVEFILDDFGTGYSNLSHMVNLPLKHIKMDKSLLWDTVKKGNQRFLLELLQKVAEQMDIELIVEGVETRKQLGYLKAIGSALGQGFFFSEPLEKEDFCKGVAEKKKYLLD
ncbi:MAG: putative bifunctional diguanylate cyclase/phosphodiesterase [Spirochaetaceae bacterium JB067]